MKDNTMTFSKIISKVFSRNQQKKSFKESFIEIIVVLFFLVVLFSIYFFYTKYPVPERYVFSGDLYQYSNGQKYWGLPYIYRDSHDNLLLFDTYLNSALLIDTNSSYIYKHVYDDSITDERNIFKHLSITQSVIDDTRTVSIPTKNSENKTTDFFIRLHQTTTSILVGNPLTNKEITIIPEKNILYVINSHGNLETQKYSISFVSIKDSINDNFSGDFYDLFDTCKQEYRE